jgi:rhamnosyltransferase
MPDVTVAIPVRDGGPLLAGVLDALARQTVEHELVVCDSGSSDGSLALAREHGARVLQIEPARFSHGGVRNRLLAASSGRHVALLTQDAQPADKGWLERLLGAFQLGDDVALAYGSYVPRPDAPVAVAIELRGWFASLAPDGLPQVERLTGAERHTLTAAALVGRRGFFTDANACIARAAWERVPFRDVAYAEDRVLAIDMLRAGHAKAFVPDAAVIHSHSYSSVQQLRRSFDEWRGLLEIYGWREPVAPGHLLAQLRGELAVARRQLAGAGACAAGVPHTHQAATLAAVARHHLPSRAGAVLGSRSDMLPAGVRRALSLEGRAGFVALHLDHDPPAAPGACEPLDPATDAHDDA